MKRHREKEWSNEEFDEWLAASDRHDAVAAAADEAGGPRLSLVPVTDRNAPWPTDLLPAPADPDAGTDAPAPAQPFDGVALPDSRKRLAGWSADRQRLFLATLAETGSVHLAATEARLSARGAYRLRARSPDFAAAWDTADRLAVGRLAALAFDRAINGRVEQVWHDGTLAAEKRVPSDRLLMWLLARLDPHRFGTPWEQRQAGMADPQIGARQAFQGQLAGLADVVAG